MLLILEGNDQNMLRVHKEKQVKKNPICDCSRSNQMLQSDQMVETAAYVRSCPCGTV